MPFKLTILGSGAAVPTGDRTVTAQYLNFNERRILIDCGEGTQLQIRRRHKKLQRIDYIFISHCHADHILGLPGLVATMSLLGRTKSLKIFCPAAVKELLEFQFKLLEVRLSFDLEFQVLEGGDKKLVLEDRILKVYSFPLNHRIDCWGFLFEEQPKEYNIIPEKIEEFKLAIPEIVKLKKGEDVTREDASILSFKELTTPPAPPIKYAYCTDTRPVEEVKDWCNEVDLMYHEATFIHKQHDRAIKTHHSTAQEAAMLAAKAGVKHLLLGHFSARFNSTGILHEEARIFHENVTCVEDGDEFLL